MKVTHYFVFVQLLTSEDFQMSL